MLVIYILITCIAAIALSSLLCGPSKIMSKRVDANQKKIVDELRKFGFLVQHLHEVGKGCRDILVGYKGTNFLFEIKDPDKPPSKRRLTKDEETWHYTWLRCGQVDIIYSAQGAIDIMLSVV